MLKTNSGRQFLTLKIFFIPQVDEDNAPQSMDVIGEC
jgi:hypothetical protein